MMTDDNDDDKNDTGNNNIFNVNNNDNINNNGEDDEEEGNPGFLGRGQVIQEEALLIKDNIRKVFNICVVTVVKK